MSGSGWGGSGFFQGLPLGPFQGVWKPGFKDSGRGVGGAGGAVRHTVVLKRQSRSVISTSWRLGSTPPPPWTALVPSARWHHCPDQSGFGALDAVGGRCGSPVRGDELKKKGCFPNGVAGCRFPDSFALISPPTHSQTLRPKL